MNPRPGRIVLLNGTSSAGKGTIARAMQAQAPGDGWLHLGLDRMLEGVDRSLIRYVDGVSPQETEGWSVPFVGGEIVGLPILGPAALRLLDEMYQDAAATANSGSAVIFDDVIYDRRVLVLAAAALRLTPCLFVGVRCPVEVAVERERQRGDRAPGGAEIFDRVVHKPGIYDLEVDTSVLDPHQCAMVILKAAAVSFSPSVALKTAVAGL
jgi:chloramphenicol 3-O phosphotransferase